MTNFGPANYGLSKHMKNILIYDSKAHSKKRFEFRHCGNYINKAGETSNYYTCIACELIQESNSIEKRKV